MSLHYVTIVLKYTNSVYVILWGKNKKQIQINLSIFLL